jgi:CHASE3 domain sensor protein
MDVRMSACEAAQRRIIDDEDPTFQAALEQVAALYSIRRVLLAALVFAPLVLVGIAFIVSVAIST